MESLEKKSKKYRSLSTILSTTFLGLIVVVLLVNSGLNIYFNFLKEQSFIATQQNQIATEAAAKVSGFIEEKFRILDQASDINDLAVSPERRILVMNKLMGRNLSFRQLLLIDKVGTPLERMSALPSTVPLHLDSEEMNILLSAVGEKKNYFSRVYFDQSTQEPIIVIAVPTKNVFGEVEGAFIAEVNLKFMWDLVDQIKVGNGGKAYVVDKEGDLIAYGDTSRVLARENLSELTQVQQFVRGNNEKETSGAISIGILGASAVSTFVALDTPQWAVVVEIPVEEAYESLIQNVVRSIGVIIASFVLAIIVATYLSRKMTRPIISLRDAAIELSQGKLDTRIVSTSQDEIGQLANAFNEMATQVQQSYKVLEEKVKGRTEDLNKKMTEVEKINSLMIGREIAMSDLKKQNEKLKGELESLKGGDDR